MLTHELNEMKGKPGNEGLKIHEVKIADIVFAFNNSQLINLLKQRGQHIQFQRYDKMREIEKQISTLKSEKYDALVRPVDAFITFEEEDGSIVAQEFEPEFTFFGKQKPSKKEFMDDELFLVESTEPTNIIWENRHWTAADYAKRTLQVVGIIACLLAVSFIAIYTCKSIAIDNAKKYPAINAQNIFTEIFNKDPAALKKYATTEHDEFVAHETPLIGYYQTYCQLVAQTDDEWVAIFQGHQDTQEICSLIATDKIKGLVANQMVTIGIVAINFILRMFIIKLIIYIGKDTESEQTRLIANGVFIVQFFNTALLLLMVNANMTEQGWFFGIFSRDTGLPDFNSSWFNEIGTTLVGAMLFNVYWPMVEFCVFCGMRNFFRLMDRSFSCNAEKTKKTTLQQYVELYSGPTFFIHYKYSSIMNITFVTMMYGLGLPVLFPIATISLLVLYCVEKLMIHYSYREPPMYDEKLNNNALAILTWAPLLFLSFGYWMLSSQQLFSNDTLKPMGFRGTGLESGHYVSSVFEGASYSAHNVAMPLLVSFWALLVLTFFRGFFYKAACTIIPWLQIGDFEIDEDLPNYFTTIDDNDRNWSQKEEENCREVLGMQVLTEETLKRFRETRLGEGHMKGTHCYDILANELYLDDFQYFSPALGAERAAYIKDDDEDEDNDNAQSDLVRMALNLAFLPEEKAKTFTFDKTFYSARGAKGSFKSPHGIN